MTIGIIGLGVVGKAVRAFHKSRGDALITYDIAYNTDEDFDALDQGAEVVFICVPTPLGENGELDCYAVTETVARFKQPHTIIIKSTVMPGTTDTLQEAFPEHSIFFVPEFLDSDTAVDDYAKPRRQAIVGVPACRIENHQMYRPGGTIEQQVQAVVPCIENWWYCLAARQAELLKLATNTFYAFRVVYSNALYDLGLTQDSLYVLRADNRIGDWGFEVLHKGYRGYGGACLPKDSTALATFARSEHQTFLSNTLRSMTTYNDWLRTQHATTEE